MDLAAWRRRFEPLADPLRMLADILRIRRNWRAGLYAPRPAQTKPR